MHKKLTIAMFATLLLASCNEAAKQEMNNIQAKGTKPWPLPRWYYQPYGSLHILPLYTVL